MKYITVAKNLLWFSVEIQRWVTQPTLQFISGGGFQHYSAYLTESLLVTQSSRH